MIENGLWEKARQLMVQFNIEQGIIEKEEQLAGQCWTHEKK